MKKNFLYSSLLVTMLITSNVQAQNAGAFAGGFADGLNRGLSSGSNAANVQMLILQQRLEIRKQYGTREIQRLDALEKNSDARLREIFGQLSGSDPQIPNQTPARTRQF